MGRKMKKKEIYRKSPWTDRGGRNPDIYSYKMVQTNRNTSEDMVPDVDNEINVIREANEDINELQMDLLSERSDDDESDIEPSRSPQGQFDNSESADQTQADDFDHSIPNPCCDCHCTRNFQQRNKTTLKSDSGNGKSDNNLLQPLHTHSVGVGNDIKLASFRTRLKLSRKCLPTTKLASIKGDKKRSEEETTNSLPSWRINNSMALIIGYSVTFVVVLLCLCGVVLMMNHSEENKNTVNNVNKSSTQFSALNSSKIPMDKTAEQTIIMDLPYRSVPREEFEKHIVNSNSAADLFKIFFKDQSLSEEQINSIIHMKTYYVKSADEKEKDIENQSDEYVDYESAPHRDPFSDDNLIARELAFEHNKEVSNHPFSSCKYPHPELVPVEFPSDSAVRYVYPKCTLLHRCRNTSGCCGNGAVCAPSSKDGIELVDRYFLVLEDSPGSVGIRPSKDIVLAKTFVNHTSCECKPLQIETNCKKECPGQFTKKRPGVDCKCTCKAGHRYCRQVVRGLAPLDESALECIKADKCIAPECQSGEFMVSTGYCPSYRRHGHNKSRGRYRKRRG